MSLDEKLFESFKNGDKVAYEQLFKTHYNSLCRFAFSFIKDKDDAEDIVQELFVKLWSNSSKLEINTSIKAYLFRSVRNTCMNYLKHEKVKNLYFQNGSSTQVSEEYTDHLANEELSHLIHASIEELPEKRKEIFLLSRSEGLKYAEIAKQLSISIKTVETQMGLALKFLREQLKHYLPLFAFCLLSLKIIFNLYSGQV